MPTITLPVVDNRQSAILPDEVENNELDLEINAMRQWVGWQEPAKGCQLPVFGFSGLLKWVIINDLHVPFHKIEALIACIKQEADDAVGVIVAGDLSDLWNFSRFPKTKREVSVRTEIQEILKVLALLSESFREVWIMGGNHDRRLRRLMMNSPDVTLDVLEYFDMVAPSVMHPITYLIKEFPNVHMTPVPKLEGAEFPFVHQVGDAVVCHAEIYSKIPNRATGNLAHWLMSTALPNGLIKPFRAVFQAHTHQAGKTWGDYGCLNIEMGCMSQYQEYHGDAKILTPRPLVRGWTVLYQDAAGRTDFELTNFVPYEK